MLPENSPFPPYWWGIGLGNAGLESVRPDVGTYGRYQFNRLPPVPVEVYGNLDWLASAPVHAANIGVEKTEENGRSLVSLDEHSRNLRLPLPVLFTRFMATPALHTRIRSNTDCFLDLCPTPVRSPLGGGYLIRFLSDSQGCLFWYLYVTSDGLDHAVVSSPCFYGTAEEQWQEEEPDPKKIVFCAESFEVFLFRFWIENEIWFAEYEKTAMPQLGLAYIEHYGR